MKKKGILMVAAVCFLLIASAFFVLRIYPSCHLFKKLAGADSICFEGTYHLENDSDHNSGETIAFSSESSSLLELLQNGKIKGEYADGTIHCFLYQEGMDTALLEFYHGENSDIINIRQMLEFGIDYVDKETVFPVRQLFNLIDASAECYVTEKQFEEITGLSILPSFDELDESGNVPFLLLTVLLKSDQITANNGSYCVKSSDHDVLPVDFSVVFTIPEERYNIEIPESSIDDDQIPIYRKIYEMVMGAFVGE